MRIKLRQRVDYPYFFTIDKVINVSQTYPEQTLDPRQLTDFHKAIIKKAAADQIIDIISEDATPVAQADFKGAPYSVNQLRRAIDIGEVTIEDAKKLKQMEESSSSPRISIIKTLDTFIKTYA